jgi:hypothetical protein
MRAARCPGAAPESRRTWQQPPDASARLLAASLTPPSPQLSREQLGALRHRGATRGLLVQRLPQALTLYRFFVWPVQHDVLIDRTAVRGDGALKGGASARARVIHGARQGCLLPAPPGAMARLVCSQGERRST